MRYFWQTCDQNDCIREYIFLTCDFITFVFTLISTINTFRFYRKFKFEMLPLSVNTGVTGLLLVLGLFEQNFQYNLVIYALQIYTYFLFAYTFSNLFLRVGKSQQQLIRIKRRSILGFLFMTGACIASLVLTVIRASKIRCGDKLPYYYYGVEVLLYIITMSMCRRIRKKIIDEEERPNQPNTEQSLIDKAFELKDQYLQQRLKQIKLLVIAFTLSVVLGIIQILVISFPSDDNPVMCDDIGNVSVLKSKNSLGAVILVVNDFTQLIPHIFVPIILYIIPIYRHQKNTLSKTNLVFRPTKTEIQKGQIAGSDFTQQFETEKRFKVKYQQIKKSISNQHN